VWLRVLTVCLVTLAGCRDRAATTHGRKSPLETGIARDLTARFATPVTVTCTMSGPVPVRCLATLADKTELPIALEEASKAEWGWHIDGLLIESGPIVQYVQEQLASLKIAQTATCGPRVQAIKPGERVSCTLSGGGAAFVTVAADGSTSLELALDTDAAAARSEPVTPERDRELTARSAALEDLEGESDGEEEVTGDGGVPAEPPKPVGPAEP
jgi:hypothetical protein